MKQPGSPRAPLAAPLASLTALLAPLAALPARLRPALERGRASAASALRALAALLRAVDWADLWKQSRENPRSLPHKLGMALDDYILASPRLQAIRERLWKAWTWAVLHDTVPREATARRREWSVARQQRHEQRDVDRMHRKEDQAKKREKKDEEERQTYSVYFE